MMMRILTFGLLTLGSLLAFAPHASAACNGILYNPLNGNPIESSCDSSYYDGTCWHTSYYYSGAVYLYNGESTSCPGYYCSTNTLGLVGSCYYYYYSDGNCWHESYDYTDPIYLHYYEYTSCPSGYSYCYFGLVYYDPNPRVGLC